MSSHWNGRQRWASAANSHAHAHAHTPAQTSVASSSSAHARRQRAAEQRRQHTGRTASAGGRRLDLIREDCDLAGPAAAVTPPPPPKAPAGTSPGSTAASSSIASLTSPLASTPTSTTGAASAAGSPPASASASARSRIHERRISALRQSGHHAAADILQKAVWKANNNNGNNDVATAIGANDNVHIANAAGSDFVGGTGSIEGPGEYGDENDCQDMMMAEMTALEADDEDDASVLTFATEATNTTPQLNESDATDVHANACVHDALVTPEKTRPATRNVHGDGETASTANNLPGTPDTVPIVSATSSPAGGSEAEAHREGWVAPEDAEVGARALADAEAERLAEEEERTAREEKEKARRQRAEEAMHLAMAAAEAKVEAERIAAEEQRRRKAGAEAAAAAAASTERSERIAAVEAQSMLLEQRRPSLSAVSAGTNELVPITSDNDHNDQDADDGSSGKAETEEKASNTSGSDCPLNYSMSSDGDNGQLPSELSSPVHVESPSGPDGANNEPDQSLSPPSSTKKKMWGRSVRKSPSQNWGQSARQSKTSPASTTSGTEEGDTDRSFSSRRSIDDAIANLSEKMFSAVSSALPPRHPSTEADHEVAESLPLPDYLPGYYSQKDSDASAAPSLRSVASSATPVAGAGTRDVSSLWDTGVDAPSALSGGATNEENDKLTFGDSGGVELSNLDRFEPEMARDLKLAGDAFRTTLKSRGMEHDATSSIDIEVGSMGEVEVFSPKISGRPTKNNGGKRKKDPFMDCSPSSSSSSRASRTLAKLMPSGCCSWCRRIPCPQKAKPVHALFLLIPIVSVMLYLCYVYFVQPNL